MNNVENIHNKHNEELIAEFSEMVHAVERAANKLVQPWKLATAILTVSLAVALLWRKP